MKYVSGWFALNTPSTTLNTSGDWHSSALDGKQPTVYESKDSIFGDWGIELNNTHNYKLPTANHLRAMLDFFEQGTTNSEMDHFRYDFIGTDEYDEVFVEQVIKLKNNSNWETINYFMQRNFGDNWTDILHKHTKVLPDLQRTWEPKIEVISDVHAQYNELEPIVDNLERYTDNKVIFIGDYLDSFDDGQPTETIDLLLKLSKKPRYVFLLGNHDDFFLETVKGSQSALNTWLINGGQTTLKRLGYSLGEYPVGVVSAFLKRDYSEYIEFLEKAKLTYTFENYFFVHAGVNFQYQDPLTQTPKEELLWIREEYYLHENTTNKVIVSGHTPVQLINWGSEVNKRTRYFSKRGVPIEIKNGTSRWLIDGGAGDKRIGGKINTISLLIKANDSNPLSN